MAPRSRRNRACGTRAAVIMGFGGGEKAWQRRCEGGLAGWGRDGEGVALLWRRRGKCDKVVRGEETVVVV